MTTDPRDSLPPRLDPACTCICHTQPGVMHVAPCCREADPKDAHTALLACLPLLRREAVTLIECEGRLIPLEGGGYTLHPEPLDDEAADYVAPYLAAIRQAEAVVGRPEDDTPDWFNDILDGKRKWRTPA